ncbi:bacterio-opsin activator domain-containing protein [Natronobacterium gregoryi]|uniref:Bacterio-opsin activator n=2 Tax=Natronobacterium gregoryi TaxID=44930 RepID=L0AGT8_NATGS|nr:bacterio-opsin activator domain-containing protein [Natronobacterium gregoryi]AFZ72305.1 PAS domain S-box [Natronobacterium gregoryi SP2]ELY62420.1 bacterio-opsin activator [Natronobacterium gregoryi SP2]PLK18480.1 PAS domain-containing protein [Natronobacterium gregoryi SP2]SFJ70043.1 PAS domain S-box-containing protein [Natronobacterium gregoryi]
MSDIDAESVEEGVSPSRAALEHLVDPVVAVADGQITYANEAARQTLGVPDVPVEPGTVLDEWSVLQSAIDQTTVGTARGIELERTPYDARVHRDDDGTTIVFRSNIGLEPTDDRVVKERAINEAPVGITISDPDREDNPLVYINDAYREITGYSYDDVVGRNCRLLQGPDSDEETIAEMAAAVDEDYPVTVEIKNYRKDGTEFWNEVTIAPVRNDEGEVTNYVGFQNDITARKEAELALERRTEELEYILDRVEGLVQDVTAAVAGSTDRSELETAVCDRIASEDAYEGAWIGERNPATGMIEIKTSAGVSPDPISTDAGHPAAVTLPNEAVAVDTAGGTTLAAFPLFYNDIEYGVLTVHVDGDREVDDRESIVLSALARAVASGVNARETSRVLETDAVVAVDLEIEDEAVAPAALAADTDCRFEYRRSVHRSGSGSETSSLFTVIGDVDELTDAAAARDDVDCRVVVDRDERCLAELAGEADPVAWLSERGVRTKAIEAEDGRAVLTLEIPRSANVRSIVEAAEDRYDRTDVRSFQQRDRDGRSRQEFAAVLESDLTDRQFAALQRAYLGGYFEWPRPTTGEELAQSMDVSRPTFHEHLRSAEAKLCRAFFEDG